MSHQDAQLLTLRSIGPYWNQYYTLFDSPTDVITLLDSNTLTQTLSHNPANLHTLIRVLSQHLFHLLALPNFPYSAKSKGIWKGGEAERDLGREALNCVRVLSRVIPFVFGGQVGGEGNEGLEDEIFWLKERIEVEVDSERVDASKEEVGQFVIDDEDDEDEPASTRETQDGPKFEEVAPLAERLLSALVDLSFVAGFTVPEECRADDGPISYVIW